MSCNLELIKEYVKGILETETTGHDYYHSMRVMNNALYIAKNKNVNLDIIKVSAITHDLVDSKITDDILMALFALQDKLNEAKCTKDDIKEILNIIQNISFSKGKVPLSIEGKIVQDADRLDALGAIGIARTFAFGGKNNRMIYNPSKNNGMNSIAHFYDKLLKLKDLMNTSEAKQIAEDRTNYMKNFLEEFYLEWKGSN